MTNGDFNQTHPRECEVFLEAIEIEDIELRDAFLEEACGNDEALRFRVNALIKADQSEGDLEPEGWIRETVNQCEQSFVGTAEEQNTSLAPWEPPSAEILNDLLESYHVESILGRGAMGAVYKGVQISLERPVAIKMLPQEFSEESEFLERFRREALAMAKMTHPNIVAIHDFGSVEWKGRAIHYIVMEYVDGTDLKQIVQNGRVDPKRVLSLVSEISAALDYAHSLGYIHRDVKPANIFVTEPGQVKVGDFGLAKLTNAESENMFKLTKTGFVLGTPYYLAPENLETSGQVDYRADLYSLGVIMYQMLTGTLPRGSFRPPSEKVPLDQRVDAVVVKLLQYKPEDRYQRASEIKDELDQILATGENPEKTEQIKKPGLWSRMFGK